MPHDLSLSESVALAVVDDGATHGFAIAALTAPQGELGRVWQVPAPVVYRALGRLETAGLVRRDAVVPGRGPQRQLIEITEEGHREVVSWLAGPVRHVRDVRSQFLLKLALLARRGEDAGPLVTAQRAEFAPIAAGLARESERQPGFDGVLAAWRRTQVSATLAFLDSLGPDSR